MWRFSISEIKVVFENNPVKQNEICTKLATLGYGNYNNYSLLFCLCNHPVVQSNLVLFLRRYFPSRLNYRSVPLWYIHYITFQQETI